MDDRLVGGRYRLHDTRAMGGMASIWRATDERTGETVAVKLLHPHLAASESARARLDREAAALGAIDHPHVVSVREVVLDEDGPAVVMDYVAGVSLAERLADGVPMPEAEAVGIALDVTEALQAVHAAGLVHRDVKPGNILIGADGRTRLIDFGIATDLEAPPDGTALTAADDVIGTLRYLAPERVDGEPATARTDLWGVAVVLFEMLAGRPAYPSATIMERASSTVDLPDRPEGIAGPVWAVIASALAIDPDERPTDAAALAAALRPLAAERVAPGPIADPWGETMSLSLPGATVAPPSPGPDVDPRGGAPSPAGGEADADDTVAPRRTGTDRRPAVLMGLAAGAVALVVLAVSLAGPGPEDAGVAAPAIVPSPAASAPVATTPPDDAVEAIDRGGKGDGDGKGKGDGDGKGNGKGRGKDD